MKLDVVYPFTAKSKRGDDFELRYSLRSLNEQPWVGNLFIAGAKPEWIKNAHHINKGDQWSYEFKDKNIIKKMLTACVDDRVGDPFVANSDDQYWMKLVKPEEMLIPPRENPAQMEMDKDKAFRRQGFRPWRNQWVKRQFETIEFLRNKQKSTICFDGHVPYLIEKDRYLKTMSQIPWEMGNGLLIVVYHGWNWEALVNGNRIEDRDGVLVRIKLDMNPEQITEKTKDALFLNHNNKALAIGMREFLQKRFPHPSRWE